MTAALVAGLLAGYGIAVPVGAVGTYLVSLTARTSLRTGVCAALGVATADGLYALAATLGGTALASALRPALGPLRWVCVLVLLALAAWGAVTAVREYRGHRLATRTAPAPPSPARAFLGLLGITLLNPTTVIYFAALVLGSQATGPAGPLEQGVFVLAAFAASASWQVLLAGSGALLGRALTGRRGRLATALAASGVMTALAVRMALAPG
ncbi:MULTISPECIES: LysE family transporter [Streptomyces]|uniref:Threonine/homoserine/homoserine lactone efflux protein n=2 Tax=Streptomyces TaxID=1883 RepID=A0AA89QNY6_STRCU|nr:MULTISPECIES: LysE family transporter [Streptomyces]MBB5815789.1 threonine/homoserine/homoserine lactone efflux protein [Streptomyces collinus]MEC7051247.1 LysE family transporter [Streptomyces violaceochromogenes]MEC7051286.1 LysE family transporter [Streptomyces violaceochromogenes]MEC7058611.1 LysE family transporter [Streptomyces violaceochromogenes]WMX68675.1 LysE family transporter [Streptomyces collinus]